MNVTKIILGAVLVAAGCAAAALQPMPAGKLPDPSGLAINAGRVIKFANPLPRMRCGKAQCGTYNNWELAFPGVLTTTGADFGNALWDLRKVVWADRRLVFVDGRTLVCQLNWIRDHVHQMKGYRHWEHDLTSFLDFILDTQRADGQFYELIKQLDDFHWTFVPPDCRILYPEDNQSLVRLELEADIEYLMVEGCLQAWRVTGDDDWLRRALPRLEKGIDYMTSDPKRWDKAHGLCMRPYTIDTWDFTNDPLSGSNRSVILSEPMAIMHGDNSGVYQAMNQLAWINERFGDAAKAASWRARAATLKANMFKHLWNGTFFCHQLPLNCEPLDAHEKERLSLSMAYALNRGILTTEQKRGVVAEYKARRKTTKGFSEWFTIDPAYSPSFKGNPPGRYVNGALSPFTAGELARGAFECGEETYGWDILDRVAKMVKRDDGKLYFLYDPISGKPQGGGPSAWGAAAILAAVDEGLAGVQDLDVQYRKIRFAPRWAVTPFDEGRYLTGYEASRKTVDVRWIFTDKGFRYHLRSPAKKVSAHLLVPSGKVPDSLYVNGEQVPFSLVTVGDSRYVDADVTPQDGIADFEVLYAEEAWFGARIPTSGEDGREDCGMTAARVFDTPISGVTRIGTLAVPKSADLPESSNASIGFECLDRGLFDPDRCYDTLAAAGVKWARCQTMWSRCEKQKGIYDFTVLDGVVDNLTRRGIRPWFSVTFGNTLYMTNCFTGAAVGCVPTLYGEECRAAWCAYVRALAKRYKGKVTHWEIWNEPNLPQFWQPNKPNADDYLALVKLTGGVIREEIPDAKIGGTTASPALNAWEKRFFEVGGAEAIDFWCGHAYTRVPERLRKQQRIASGSSDDYVAVLKDVRAFIDAHGGKHVDIWQGESGFPSWFPAGHWLWWPKSVCKEGWQSQANQAKWLLRRFVTDRRAGIARSSFFQMADISRHYSMATTTQTHPAEHGIVNGWTYKPKMSCHAFGHYNALLATARHDESVAVSVTAASDAGAPTVATTFRAANGAPLFLYYTAFDFSGAYTGTCYTAQCDAMLTVPADLAPKDPVLVDMLRGGVYAVAVDGRAGARPFRDRHASGDERVTFANLPLVDYPLVLCDRSAVKFRRRE